MTTQQTRNRGFNMVEMLVVVGMILTIVTAITFPGIWKAYDRATEVLEGAQGTGVTGEYYAGSSRSGGILNTLITSQNDEKINMRENTRPAGVPNDHYSVRWMGMIRAEEAGSYTLEPRSDDGSIFVLNGQEVHNDITAGHGMRGPSLQVTLEAGQYATFEYTFNEFGGGSGADLFWTGPNVTRALIPTSNLFDTNTKQDPSVKDYNAKLQGAIDMSKNVRYHR